MHTLSRVQIISLGIVVLLAIFFATAGCDNRGPAERNFDAQLAQVKDPQQHAMMELMLRKTVQETDRQTASMTPREREAVQTLMANTNNPTPAANNTATGNPKIGIQIEPIDIAYATALHIPMGTGLRVTSVMPGSTAEAAGIRAGDFILSVDGETITNIDYLNNHNTGKSVGDTISLRIVREDQAYNATVALGSP